jgi:Conjugative transposon protein TcpC
MARRPAVEHGPQTAAQDPPGQGPADPWGSPDQGTPGSPDGKRRRGGGGRWGGSGGRWWIWIGRTILWAFILVVIVNGIRAPFERFTAKPAAVPTAGRNSQKTQFPESAASAYALQFAGVYLSYDQKNPASRETQLSYFLPDGADQQFGWDGSGQMAVQQLQVAGVDVRDPNDAIVTLLVKANDKWLQLAVPVYAKDGAMVISGQPALLPAPPRAALPQPAAKDRDSGLEAQLKSRLETFFKAYASSDQSILGLLYTGGPITGLNGVVNFAQLTDVVAPPGAANQRTVTATVSWQVPSPQSNVAAAKLQQTYQLTVVKKDDGNWYVKDIQGATA